ncbi:hypothetical protein FIV00_17265 [Labrenzia sp. THAF82]|uniref:hypothetical protein n=1 Tax=Labrenzia sp. THAF82 TaxID=2587861 RepID=UPI0012AA32D0|nr:hypothetical protein [Labrenzia sp. THAF82]QFT32244.1 hypothetical protein FIV00_17265 [Labrenzia sp. THAF82]
MCPVPECSYAVKRAQYLAMRKTLELIWCQLVNSFQVIFFGGPPSPRIPVIASAIAPEIPGEEQFKQ